jgi:hypothetical protein
MSNGTIVNNILNCNVTHRLWGSLSLTYAQQQKNHIEIILLKGI